MNENIVKTFIGKHVDLSKVVAISDAYFIDRMGFGGYYVGFDIYVQLLNEPIHFERELEREKEYKYTEEGFKIVRTNDGEILAVKRLQEQIDELVEQWKSVEQAKKLTEKEKIFNLECQVSMLTDFVKQIVFELNKAEIKVSTKLID